MSTSKKSIRKAFEDVLETMVAARDDVDAKNLPIRWPGLTFSDSGRDFYFAPTMMFGAETARDLGRDSVTKIRGIFRIGVSVRVGMSTDPLDALVDALDTAYPLGTDLVVEGRHVQIDSRTAGDLLQPPGWSYRPFLINWSLGV